MFRRLDPRPVLAFAAIYFLWGGTFLAIRVAVLSVPPLFASGLRFLVAGTALYAFVRLRGTPAPTAPQWRTLGLTALCMFVVTYGLLFWAEQYVPSGLTSVIEAMLPVIAATLEVFVFRQQPFRWRTALALALGSGGVAWLLLDHSTQSVPIVPCLAILTAGVSWSLGAVLLRSLPKPTSTFLTAGAQMMLGGAVLLALSGLTGEAFSVTYVPLRALLALTYLILAGSLISFTAFVWLLARMPATRVASHAYVNPLVAVLAGCLFAGEVLTARMLVAATLILVGVVLIVMPGAAFRATRSATAASVDRLRRARLRRGLPSGRTSELSTEFVHNYVDRRAPAAQRPRHGKGLH
ncbi:MAG: EamA family transporter [Gammaproteobacteria bacterium]|nr:EamA family transporter [Gammaproteobacteria bacterium]